jgi:RNA polymerase sigma-70 factor, ECF subfamily
MGGDRDAFSALASRALPRLVGTAGLILGRVDAAEDAVQESLVRAWRDLPTLRDPDRFEPWLYRVLVRACTDEARRTTRFSRTEAVIGPLAAGTDPADFLAERDAVAAGLRRLDLDHRTVLVLRYYLDLSHPQIANALGVPIGTVKSRISRALPAMRAALDAVERGGAAETRPA